MLFEIGPGIGGTVEEGVTVCMIAFPVPQPLEAATLIEPDVLPALTVIVLVPWPETKVQPFGNVHSYSLTPAWAGTEYVKEVCPIQGTNCPEIGPTTTGGFVA